MSSVFLLNVRSAHSGEAVTIAVKPTQPLSSLIKSIALEFGLTSAHARGADLRVVDFDGNTIGHLSESELTPHDTHAQLLAEGFADFFYEFVPAKTLMDRGKSIRNFSHFRLGDSTGSVKSALGDSGLSTKSNQPKTPTTTTSHNGDDEDDESTQEADSVIHGVVDSDDDEDQDDEDEDDEGDDDSTSFNSRTADGDLSSSSSSATKTKKKKKTKHHKHRSHAHKEHRHRSSSSSSSPAPASSTQRARTDSTSSPPTSKLTERERRGRVLAEILATERSYIASLKKILQLYVTPIRAAHGTPAAIVTPDDEVKIFSNIDRLIPLNTALADGLEQRGAQSDPDAAVGDLFLRFTETLDAYLQYINMFDLSQERYQANLKSNKVFRAFCDACTANEAAAGLPLNAYLIMPIQRSPRYVLLLEQLVKSTPESHVDYQPLTRAWRSIRAFTDMLNRRKQELEDEKQLEAMLSKFDRIRFRFIIEGRRFVQRSHAKYAPIADQREDDDEHVASLIAPDSDSAATANTNADIANILNRTESGLIGGDLVDAASTAVRDVVLWLFSDLLLCTTPKSLTSRKYEALWHVDLAPTYIEHGAATAPANLYNLRVFEERQLPLPPFSRVVRRNLTYLAGKADGVLFGELVQSCIDATKRKQKPPATERAVHLIQTLLQPADWQLLFAGGANRVFDKGEVILKYDEAGDAAATPWRVVSGSVSASRTLNGLKAPVVFQTFVAGDVFGEDSFLAGGATFDYVAMSRSTNVVQANAGVLLSMLEARPAVAERFYQRCSIALAHRLITAPVQSKIERALRVDVCGEAIDAQEDERRKLEANAAELEELRRVIDRAVLERAPAPVDKKQRDRETKKERDRQEAIKLREKFELPPDELLVTRAVCQVTHKKVSRAKSEIFIFQSCIVAPYRHFGLAHRVKVPHTEIVSLETEGGNAIVLESRDPKQARYSRLFLKYTFIVDGTLVRDELFKSMNSLWLAAAAAGDGASASGSTSASPVTAAMASRAASSASLLDSPMLGNRHGGNSGSGGDSDDARAKYAALAPRDAGLLLTDVDWHVLFGDASEQTFNADEVIVERGHCYRRLYHIQEGELDVVQEKEAIGAGGLTHSSSAPRRLLLNNESQAVVIGHMATGTMFGDISFLLGGGASVTLRASTKTRVSWVERHALTPLFDRNALLAGKFYKYVALGMRKRVVVLERRLYAAANDLVRRAALEAASKDVPQLDRQISVNEDNLPPVRALARSGQLHYALGRLARSSRRAAVKRGSDATPSLLATASSDQLDIDDDDDVVDDDDEESMM